MRQPGPDEIKSDADYHDDGSAGGDRPPTDGTADRNTGYDDFARHKYWHFVDTPFSTDGTTLPPIPTPNAETQVVTFRGVLKSSQPDALKSYDLTWLLHLVGDLHQPLHCATRVSAKMPNGDNGGNGDKVSCTGCPPKLHTYWDDVLGKSSSFTSAIKVAKALPTPDATKAGDLAEADWVNESFTDAKSAVYKKPSIGAGTGPFTLSAKYQATAKKLAQQRIALAGARLAALLNTALGSAAPTPVVTPVNDQSVFINPTGHAYHLATCRYVGPHSQKVSVSDAKAKGRTACGVCKPPQ